MNPFVAAAMTALRLLGATPAEQQELALLLREESRGVPTARNGMCCGLWQTRSASEEGCLAVQRSPELAAGRALLVFRQKVHTCGWKHWKCCWKSGENSAKCRVERGKSVKKESRKKKLKWREKRGKKAGAVSARLS